MIGRRLGAILVGSLLLASCAQPPLKLYTLVDPVAALSVSADDAGLPVVYLSRVAVPDYLDSDDILVRDGNTLRRSSNGRLATRLSLGATDLIRERLSARYPALLVSAQPQIGPPAARLVINITRLDVSVDETAALVADWSVSISGKRRDTHARAGFSMRGSVATDGDVVALERDLLIRLAGKIVLPTGLSAIVSSAGVGPEYGLDR